MDRETAQQTLRERGIAPDDVRLLAYARAGNVEVVRLLLAAGVTPSANDGNGESAVVAAAGCGHKDVAEALLEAGADPAGLVRAVADKSKGKDLWERLTSLSGVFTLISSLTVAGVGWFFTSSYNQSQLKQSLALAHQQNRVLEMQTVEKMIPHLTKDEQSKKMALLVISRLATPELATGMMQLVGGEGAVEAAKTIAIAGEATEKQLAVTALTGIAATGGAGAATAALDALGTVFKGKEKALVKVLRGDQAACSGFLVDAKRGWFATAGYCVTGFPEEPIALETSSGTRLPVTKVVPLPESPENFAETPVVMMQADATGLAQLEFATQPPVVGNRVVGIGFAGGRSELVAVVGLVQAIGVAASESRHPLVNVKLEGRTMAGTGGGPFIDGDGRVVCMIFVGTQVLDQCLPADSIRRTLTQVVGTDAVDE